MARRRSTGPAVSLFSFLDLLSGLIGTLTLIIAGLTIFALQEAEQILEVRAVAADQKSPRFVECTKQGLVLLPQRIEAALEELDQDDGVWRTELDKIAENTESRYIVFLIRPDGLESFKKASTLAKQKGVETGYDPVYSAGPIQIRQVEGDSQP